MQKKQIVLFIILSLSLLIAACSAPQAAAAESVQIADGLGRQVNLPANPQRIVSLAPANTEILFAVGAGKQVVGRDDFSDYPPEAKELPTIGGLTNINLEEIARLKPDLVLASQLNTPEQVEAIEGLNTVVFYLNNPKDLEGMLENVKLVGKLSGHEKEAVELTASLKSRIEKIQEAMKGTTSRPKVFYEVDATDSAKPWTAGPGTHVGLLVDAAGGKNLGNNLTSEWAQISQEELIVQDPEIIVLGDFIFGVTPEQVKTRPGWEKMRAVKNNQVYEFDDNLVSRPGPRMVDGLIALIKIIHPEVEIE